MQFALSGGLNGTTDLNPYGQVTFTGTDPACNVFTFSATQLATIDQLTLNAPAGSTAIVNVTGSAASLSSFGFFLNGIDRTRVLYNFVDATTLSTAGVGIQGSVLAPWASVTQSGGSIDGQWIVASHLGNIEEHHFPFVGNINVPEPATLGLVGAIGLLASRRRHRRG